MTVPFTKTVRKPKRGIGVVFVTAVPGCIFMILTVITNTHWIPVYIPSLPWKSNPVLFAFETPLIAALAVSFALGCLVTYLIWRAIYRQSKIKQGALRQHVLSLENALEKTQRLISTAAAAPEQSRNSSDEQEKP